MRVKVAKKEASSETKSKRLVAIIIIVLLLMLIGLVSAIGYYMVGGDLDVFGSKEAKPKEEYTVLLDEFVLNLRPENNVKNYIKVRVALMCTNEEDVKVVDANVNKLRDVIIADLREKTATEILDNGNISNIKTEMVTNLNEALNRDMINGVYFIDLVVQ